MNRSRIIGVGAGAAVLGALGLGFVLGRSLPSAPPTSAAELSSEAASPPGEELAALPQIPPEQAPEPAEEAPAPSVSVPAVADSSFLSDPQQVLRTAFRSRDAIERFLALADILKNLNASNIHLAIQTFENLPHQESYQQELSMLLQAWASFDGPAAIAWVDKLAQSNPSMRYEASRSVLKRWAAYDGPSAMAWFSKVAEAYPRMLYYGSRAPLSGWASTDPEGALAWATEHATEEEENYFMIGVIEGIATHDLGQASTVMKNLPYGRARAQAVDIMSREYLKQGNAESQRWAESIEEDRLRVSVVARVAGGMVRQDPEAATAWAVSLASEEDRVRAVEEVAAFRTRYAPRETADWAMMLEDPPSQKTALENVVQHWAHRDTGEVADWLSQYPASPTLDEPVAIMVGHLQRKDPETALNWALSITDEKARHRVVQEVMAGWTQQDPETAQRAFNP